MAHLAFVAHLTARILVSHLVKEIGWRQIVKQSAFLAQVLLRTYVFKESSSLKNIPLIMTYLMKL